MKKNLVECIILISPANKLSFCCQINIVQVVAAKRYNPGRVDLNMRSNSNYIFHFVIVTVATGYILTAVPLL